MQRRRPVENWWHFTWGVPAAEQWRKQPHSKSRDSVSPAPLLHQGHVPVLQNSSKVVLMHLTRAWGTYGVRDPGWMHAWTVSLKIHFHWKLLLTWKLWTNSLYFFIGSRNTYCTIYSKLSFPCLHRTFLRWTKNFHSFLWNREMTLPWHGKRNKH